MAILYVNDGGSNTAPYDTLAKAAVLFGTAVAAAAAGDDIYVGMDHVETPGVSTTYAFPGTAAAPNRVISINTISEAYDKADNIQIDNTGAGFDLTLTGHVKFYGISMRAGDDLLFNVTDARMLWDDCELEMDSVNGKIKFGHLSGRNFIQFKNTNINFSGGGANAAIESSTGIFEMRGGTITKGSGAAPTALVNGSTRTGFYSFAGVDLSDWPAASALVDVSNAADIQVEFHHCILRASTSLTTGTIAGAGTRILMSGCDDTTGNDLYRFEYVDYYGSIVHDDAIFRDDGASDNTNNISWKMVTTANATDFSESLVSPPIVTWVDSTGSKTFTIHLNWDSATDLINDEAWLEVEYLEASADTGSAFADDSSGNFLATTLGQTTNTENWTGTGGFTNENKQQLDVTVTINRVGPIIARVHLAKPSTTIYIDPKIEIS